MENNSVIIEEFGKQRGEYYRDALHIKGIPDVCIKPKELDSAKNFLDIMSPLLKRCLIYRGVSILSFPDGIEPVVILTEPTIVDSFEPYRSELFTTLTNNRIAYKFISNPYKY